MTEWTDLVKQVYNENKGKAGYKFKNALKDAAKIYKKKGSKSASKKTGRRRKSRKH